MALPAFLLLILLVLSAIALPVVFALRRGARLAALIAGTTGFGAQALFVSYLQAGGLGAEHGAMAIMLGIPAVAIATSAVTMLVLMRVTTPRVSPRSSAD